MMSERKRVMGEERIVRERERERWGKIKGGRR